MIDNNSHDWFQNGRNSSLHLAIDDATSTIIGAWFDKQETLNGYYHVFYQILTNYDIPYKFFTDNRTVFNYMSLNPDKRTSNKDVLTQYGYDCKQLDIEFENLVDTFQGKLVNELKLNSITTIKTTNKNENIFSLMF